VVPFLNGMRHVEPLVSRFGSAVLGGVLRISTEQTITTEGSSPTSSLSRDLMADHQTEVEPVLGDLVASADGTATPTPLLALAALALRIHNRRLEAANGA
jgi:ketopantoate reductase